MTSSSNTRENFLVPTNRPIQFQQSKNILSLKVSDKNNPPKFNLNTNNKPSTKPLFSLAPKEKVSTTSLPLPPSSQFNVVDVPYTSNSQSLWNHKFQMRPLQQPTEPNLNSTATNNTTTSSESSQSITSSMVHQKPVERKQMNLKLLLHSSSRPTKKPNNNNNTTATKATITTSNAANYTATATNNNNFRLRETDASTGM